MRTVAWELQILTRRCSFVIVVLKLAKEDHSLSSPSLLLNYILGLLQEQFASDSRLNLYNLVDSSLLSLSPSVLISFCKLQHWYFSPAAAGQENRSHLISWRDRVNYSLHPPRIWSLSSTARPSQSFNRGQRVIHQISQSITSSQSTEESPPSHPPPLDRI